MPELVGPLWEYWLRVNGEDLQGVRSLLVNGKHISIHASESKIYQLLADRCQVQIATHGPRIVGFMLYYLLYNRVLAIEGVFVCEGYAGQGVAKGLINGLGKDIHKVYFETRNENPSIEALRLTEGKAKKLGESDGKTLWEMEWRP